MIDFLVKFGDFLGGFWLNCWIFLLEIYDELACSLAVGNFWKCKVTPLVCCFLLFYSIERRPSDFVHTLFTLWILLMLSDFVHLIFTVWIFSSSLLFVHIVFISCTYSTFSTSFQHLLFKTTQHNNNKTTSSFQN